MKRYADTFFHYWLLVLIPIIVLPLATGAYALQQPKSVEVTADLWVSPADAGTVPSYNDYESPAQNQADNLNQLLLTSSFDYQVATAAYTHLPVRSRTSNLTTEIADSLYTSLQLAARGSNLLNITYKGKDAAVAYAVVQGFIDTAGSTLQRLNQQQTTAGLTTATAQLQTDKQRLNQEARQLRSYMARHGITVSELTAQMSVDPALATLYQQVQNMQSSVNSDQQQVTKLQNEEASPYATASAGFTVQDPPAETTLSSKKTDLLFAVLGLVAGLVLGGGFVIARTMLDRTVRFAEEVPELLDLPVLAVVPYSATLAAQRQSRARGAGAVQASR